MENRITVFVPTYNRAHLLDALFTSFAKQEYKNFTVLIIDDGSLDNTKEVVKQWRDKKIFDIQYVYQENGGKHAAYNRAIEEAKTELFVEMDSDDLMLPHALQTIIHYWDTKANKDEIGNLQFLCQYKDGRLIGTKFVKEVSNNYQIRKVDRVKGDKITVYHTPKLKEFSFPTDIKGEFVIMSILHNRVSSKYKVLCVNEIIAIKDYLEGGITSTLKKKIKPRHQSFAVLNNEYNYFNLTLDKRFFYNSKYVKNALLAKKSVSEIWKNAINRKPIFVLSFLHGYITYWIKKIKNKNM
ncbi:glycosyltransferase family A protein [Ochrovirga pacifica]|uniref:glycosyltransferase family A protein n=1 Tax=Ochrovirga pacifica TaxID=1042376 RepID=UPI000255871F|nr:glycosyltransferase family 2 protein [Ochrovirga pacifica]